MDLQLFLSLAGFAAVTIFGSYLVVRKIRIEFKQEMEESQKKREEKWK